MTPKKVCQICQIIKYHDLAIKDAKYKYQVDRYLKLAQIARKRILKSDLNADSKKVYFCKHDHYFLAREIQFQHNRLVTTLSRFTKQARENILKELSEHAFNHAKAVIEYGIDSVEASETRFELEAAKKMFARSERQKSELTV